MSFTLAFKGHDEDRRVVWPPKLIQHTPLGYLYDLSGNYLPRDIGRSSVLSDGTALFQFGDTFCHSMDGTFLGVSTNTCSVLDAITDHGSIASSYFNLSDKSGVGRSSEERVPPFLSMLPGEGDTDTHMFKIWCFSGIVETHKVNGNTYGSCWYEAREIEKGTNRETAYLYTGIATVVWNREKNLLEADRSHNAPLKHFLASEPRFGAFCAVRDGQFIYLYGHTPDESKTVVLARVPLQREYHKGEHQYWDGTNWSLKMRDSKAVFTTMQHGQIFQTEMFGRDSVWKWAFIGCNSFGDSKALFGRATAPQGPWEIHEIQGLKTYTMVEQYPESFRYCFYPHPWAFDIKKGDLMISWNEGGMNGSVIAEKLRFETTTTSLSQH